MDIKNLGQQIVGTICNFFKSENSKNIDQDNNSLSMEASANQQKNDISTSINEVSQRIDTQNQVKSAITNDLDRVCEIIARADDPSNHSAVARIVCEDFGFRDPNGYLQEKTCLTALQDLAAQGKIDLPHSSHQTSKNPIRICSEDVQPLPAVMPESVDMLKNLTVQLVSSQDDIHVWNAIYEKCGGENSRLLIGRVVKYLIKSENNILGCIIFGSPKINSKNRDNWIGWSKEIKLNYQNLLRGMDVYFLPELKIQGLEKVVLDLVMHIFPQDHKNIYGEDVMLVETYINRSYKLKQKIFRDLGWEYAGCMNLSWMYEYVEVDPSVTNFNLGTLDFANKSKDFDEYIPYIFVLNENFRVEMGIPSIDGLGKREILDHINEEDWVKTEIGNNGSGDKRIDNKFVAVLDTLSKKPTNNVCECTEGDKSKRDAVYSILSDKRRTYKDKITNRVNITNKSSRIILNRHTTETLRRCKANTGTTLFIGDTFSLNYNTHPNCKGLIRISSNGPSSQTLGLKVPHTIAVNENGLILGEVSLHFMSERDEDTKNLPSKYVHPIDKESFKWMAGLLEVSEYSSYFCLDDAVYVADREAPSHLLFYIQRERNLIDIVARSKGDFKVYGTNKNVEKYMEGKEIKATIKIHLDKQTERSNGSQRVCKAGRQERDAEFAVRFEKIMIAAPSFVDNKEPIELFCVYATEINAPKGVEKIKWCLLTTIKVETIDDALKVINIYHKRWVIEEFHRVLENTCNVESFRNDNAERIKRLISFYIIIAWRIMLILQLGRMDKNIPTDFILREDKLIILEIIGKNNYNHDITTISDANNVIGKLGGYTDQVNSTLGYEVFARGQVVLEHMTEFYTSFINILPNWLRLLIILHIKIDDPSFVKKLEPDINILLKENLVSDVNIC